MIPNYLKFRSIVASAFVFVSCTATAQTAYYQLCDKIAVSNTPNTGFGNSTSLSTDGNTLVVGAPGDAGNTGAAFVYTRNGCFWTNPVKLTGTGNIGAAYQGQSVAVSADGNTITMGGPGDNGNVGAVWIFAKSGSVWNQQAKLVGNGMTGTPLQGYSVGLSGDGNTVVIGGPTDNALIGAIWVFSRSGSTWSQMGTKIIGSGYSFSDVEQGISVGISADGSTIALGGPQDAAGTGAVWFFIRSGSSWTQQGALAGTGPYPKLGSSISLSADGNTVAVGAAGAGNGTGGSGQGHVEIFVRTGSTWARQGSYLLGTNAIGYAQQGGSVGLSSDGNTLVFGGGANVYRTLPANLSAGQFWVFTRSGNTWTQAGQKYIGTGGAGNSQQGSSVSISGDGKTIVDGGFADNDSAGAVWTYATTQCTGICPSLAVHTFAGEAGLKVFPNPSTGILTIKVPGTLSAKIYVSISNVMGQIVKQQMIPANVESRIALNVPDGVYYLHAMDDAGVKQTIKIQITH